jgi:NADPH:quinone reductase-like Zn-dependent oxidoreductase
MKAVRIHRFGGPEVVMIEDVPVPTRGEQEVLVHVAAAGVGPVGCAHSRGQKQGEPAPTADARRSSSQAGQNRPADSALAA